MIQPKIVEDYLEKVASSHNLQNFSDKETYPIPRLKENFEVITQTYNLLNEHAKFKIPIHSAGEWILDNYYVIDESVKNIKLELPKHKYTKFLGLANGNYTGFARVYVLASEIVNYTDNKIDAIVNNTANKASLVFLFLNFSLKHTKKIIYVTVIIKTYQLLYKEVNI